jgi:outer membrane protein OmpA-like peptidoglycan-associated protein
MSDILFDVGKATLTTDLKTSLAKIAGILTIYKDANVLVEGHTDNVGGEDYNQKLSEKRAQNVMAFMVNPGGIAQARLSSQGHGFSKPIADNATKEGRQKNRRVDLVVMDRKSP